MDVTNAKEKYGWYTLTTTPPEGYMWCVFDTYDGFLELKEKYDVEDIYRYTVQYSSGSGGIISIDSMYLIPLPD
jgi:hypothetical protein